MPENKNILDRAEALKDGLDKPVVLIGMMGCGKSHAGSFLARALGLEFVDSDKKIEEAAGCSVQEIFERDGEKKFRDAEKRIIGKFLNAGVLVLATGGGAILDMGTMSSIKDKAISIWIDADIEDLLARLQGKGDRPLLAGGNPKKVLEDLLKERRPLYEKADITMRGEGDSVVALVDDMIAALHEFLCGDDDYSVLE